MIATQAGTTRPLPMPKLWGLLVGEWLGLRSDLVHTWWQAVSKSADPGPQALVAAIVTAARQPYPAQQADATREALILQLAPDALVETIETLVTQGLLLRREATVIEEHILHNLDALGQWRP